MNVAKDEKSDEVLFYLIEKTNKMIRRYYQEQLTKAGLDITIDQWLVMKKVSDGEGISQVDLAEAIIKDTASITRILNLLLKKKLIKKNVGDDKRENQISLTDQGRKFVDRTLCVVKDVQKKGTETMHEHEVENMKCQLEKIIQSMS